MAAPIQIRRYHLSEDGPVALARLVLVGSPTTRHVWSAALLQVKSESDRLVCANVFGLCWSFAPGQDGMSCALFLRLARVWTQTYLPVHAGVGRNYISDLELGKMEIGLRDLHLLAQSFGVTLVRLVHGL